MCPKISVVIPVYNEKDNVRILSSKLESVLNKLTEDFEVIFVDDGSIDGTLEILREISMKDRRFKVISFRRNFGQTAALLAGFEYAKSDIIISLDADLQNDPEDIPKILSRLNEGYDVVCGWRRRRKDPLSKRIASRLSNWLARRLTGIQIHDFGCTLRAYRREAVKDLDLYGEMHRFIPALIGWRGFKITEIEVIHHPRKYGKTKYGLSRIFKGLLDLLMVKFFTSYLFRPMHVFGGIGFIISLIGSIFAIYLVCEKIIYNVSLTTRPLFTSSLIMIITGLQFIVFGVMSELIMRGYMAAWGKRPYEIKEIIKGGKSIASYRDN